MKHISLYIFIIAALQMSSCSILRYSAHKYVEESKGVDIEMAFVEGGEFSMGDNDISKPWKGDDFPPHDVSVNSFFISKYEITYHQYDIYCKETGLERQKFLGDEKHRKKSPVVFVNWIDAKKFCHWLSETTGKKYRLPTEAEWEYAARGGKYSKGYDYAGSNRVEKVAWFVPSKFWAVPLESTEPGMFKKYSNKMIVGKKRPNELRLYDMSGSVWEWCEDTYDAKFYKSSPRDNPVKVGVLEANKSARGGCWFNDKDFCLVVNRDHDTYIMRDYDLGFRIVLEIEQ